MCARAPVTLGRPERVVWWKSALEWIAKYAFACTCSPPLKMTNHGRTGAQSRVLCVFAVQNDDDKSARFWIHRLLYYFGGGISANTSAVMVAKIIAHILYNYWQNHYYILFGMCDIAQVNNVMLIAYFAVVSKWCNHHHHYAFTID